MDKYEEAAREFCGTYSASIEEFASAFRWFDERREKETCEWTVGDVKGKGYSHCPYCGKPIPTRIVEKEGK